MVVLSHVKDRVAEVNSPGKNLDRFIKKKWSGTKASFAVAVGVSAGYLSRLISGELDLRKSRSLNRITELLDVSEAELLYESNPEGPGSEDGEDVASAAEELLEMLRERAGYRRIAREMTNKDLVATAYTIALADRWPAEDFKKLDALRNRVLGNPEA